eukprot:TRINITY_DN40043_c0_g1_i1.p1 TRINITY_DN40043_c0_g1~~TRINITY_DN40043_c0_g1_i1.p1  ORF type:complete len:1026 (+),score=259.44 TRINITY_DN40043_c0_g1_i1:194-3271(+)
MVADMSLEIVQYSPEGSPQGSPKDSPRENNQANKENQENLELGPAGSPRNSFPLRLPVRQAQQSEGAIEMEKERKQKGSSSVKNRTRPATPPGRSNSYQAPSTNVRVVCRLRPMSDKEIKVGTIPAATASMERKEVAVVRTLANGTRQVRSTFNFDDVLTDSCRQEDVFNATLRPLVGQVLAGYETTAFAYGQTGTGKTYTMEGDLDHDDGMGLVPRTATAIMDALASGEYSESSVTVSYLEIYNEELCDLLALPNSQQKLEVREGIGGVCCMGLSEVPVSTTQDVLNLVRRAQVQRRVAETRVNARSSRSHSIFTMKVRCRKPVAVGELENYGKLHLVDLAGSECAKKGGPVSVEDALTMRMNNAFGGLEEFPVQSAIRNADWERKNINQSLLTLGRVISALREGSGRVPYRDSKLTRLLQDALGGHCRTVIIATISPAYSVVDETISTLSYAEQASGIRNRPVASSLLRSFRPPPAAQTPSMPGVEMSGSSSGFGAREWAELEMKVAYLSHEASTAQAALANKYQETMEHAARAERLEGRVAALEENLVQAKLATAQEAFARQQLYDFAAQRTEDAKQLDDALDASLAYGGDLETRLHEQESNAKKSRLQAEKCHRSAAEEVIAASKVLQESSKDAGEAVGNLLQVQQGTCDLGAKLQEDQCELVKKLAETLRCGQDHSNMTVAALASKAKDALNAEAVRAAGALDAIEAAASATAEAAATGLSSCTAGSERRSQLFQEKAKAIRRDLAARREALKAAANRASTVLAAAAEAVSELSGLAEDSMTVAEEALVSLEEMEVEAAETACQEVSNLRSSVEDGVTKSIDSVTSSRQAAESATQQALTSWEAAESQCRILAVELEASFAEVTAEATATQEDGARSMAMRRRRGEEVAAEVLTSVGDLEVNATKALKQQAENLRQALAEKPLAAFQEKESSAEVQKPQSIKRPAVELIPMPSMEELAEKCQKQKGKANRTMNDENLVVPKFPYQRHGTPRSSSTGGKIGSTIAGAGRGALKELNHVTRA